MEHKIIVAGIGPGSPDYLVPAAKRAIDGASVLVGGQRALEQFAHAGQETMAIHRDIAGVLKFIREKLEQQDVVAMVSGDPGYFSLLDALRREFPEEYIDVIPGISSMQLAFARLALPWHGARLLSLHGREPREEELAYHEGAVLGMLTDVRHSSKVVAGLLLRLGWTEDADFFVCTRLSYADERILRMTLRDAVHGEGETNCILIARDSFSAGMIRDGL